MNKTYLLIICLLLTSFTGCLDVEEPEEEEIIRAWDFFAIEVDHNIVPNLTNHVAVGIANLGSHSATFDVSFNSSYPMHFMGSSVSEGMLSLDPGDVRILLLEINSTSDFKSANISAKMNWVGGSDSKSISLNFNYVPKGEKVEIGDTADFHYAGFLQRNGHLFDTSIEYIWDNYDYFVEWTTINRHITTIPARHIGCNSDGNPSENCEGSRDMIPGFDQGMLGMYGNQTLYVVIPPEDAYGNSGNLAGETLIFSIRIVSVEKKESVEGCMDSEALNYDPEAEVDDGSCEYSPVEGCTDSNAINYDSEAEVDDGSCEYPPVEGCMDPDATNYDSEAEVDDGLCEYPDTCPSGSTIAGDTADAGYANPGAVFSENSNLPDEHDPKRITFTVTLNGSALEDCIVKSEIDEDNGWFFYSNNRTNSDGEIYGYWTAGSEIGLQTMRAYVTWPDGEKKYANVTGEVSDTSSRTNSIHLNYYPSGTYDSFSVQATPGTGPVATYYSTINWRGAYGGIQFDGSTTKVIFSTWDVNGMNAEIRDTGDCNDVVDFGGEGTGVSCRLLFPPSEHGAIPGLPDDYMLVPGHTYDTTIEITDCGTNCQDYSFNFTDVTRGFGPISLGIQRYKDDAPNDYASSFVEEWTPHGNCLSAERSVLYHNIKARVDGVWENIDTARFTPNYYRSNNEICANYFAEGNELGFLISSGGDRLVGPPRIDGDSAFPYTRYIYLVGN